MSAAAVVAPYFWIPTRAQTRMVRHASFGAGGQASSTSASLPSTRRFELVAVADVDLCRLDRVLERFPKARLYQDWRELLKKEGGRLDSVNVSTPDHMHALLAMEAMRQGKHVYVQKPLANTLRETRALTEYARKARVISQMGIQVSSEEPQRYGEWLVRSGIVGKIREVHTFSNKNWGDDKPLARGRRPGAADAGLEPVARRRRLAAVQAQRLPSRRMAATHRVWDRHARRHGLSHLQPALSRVEIDGPDQGHLPRPDAVGGKLGDQGQSAPRLSRDRVHRGPRDRRVVV